MALSPSSTVYLLDVPLDNTYNNEIYFASQQAQYNYFSNKVTHYIDNVTYQRADNVIRVQKCIDELYNSNYVMYQNKVYGQKWFYAFITKMEAISDGLTYVHIETDVYQTWMFETQIRQSFVVREHVMDDTIFKNITDEGLDTGEFVRANVTKSGSLDDMSIVVAISGHTDGTYYGTKYGGIYSGLHYSVFPATSIGAVNDLLQQFSATPDRIVCIFMCPSDFVTESNSDAKDYMINPINRPTSFQGYTPKNNKLYCYPYSFLYVISGSGGSATFRYEFMTTPDTPSSEITGDFSPSPTIYLIPIGYKGIDTNYDEKLTLTNYPICSWDNDVFTAWLAQNRNSIAFNTLGNLVELGTGIATANPMVASAGMMGIFGQISQIKDRSIQPPQAKGNTVGGGSALATGQQDFFFIPSTITREYAERIDSFFELYGYKINKLKVPNINGRPHWNYVKTIDCNITGSIPSDDMVRLKKMFDDGVTIWKNGDEIGNYSLNNH